MNLYIPLSEGGEAVVAVVGARERPQAKPCCSTPLMRVLQHRTPEPLLRRRRLKVVLEEKLAFDRQRRLVSAHKRDPRKREPNQPQRKGEPSAIDTPNHWMRERN